MDQQHAFDFHFGAFRTHILSRASATKWVKMTGTVIDQPLWGGKANLEKIEASGSGSHFQGLLTIFLYNQKSGQWSQHDRKTHQWWVYFANSSSGVLDQPMVGEFKGSVGTFVFLDEIDGKTVLVRNVWSGITSKSCHQDWAISTDGGKTWVPTWISTDTLGNR